MHVAIPDDWQNGLISPLQKSGYIYDLDNYTGITLSPRMFTNLSRKARNIDDNTDFKGL
jgi:hypothetical protein